MEQNSESVTDHAGAHPKVYRAAAASPLPAGRGDAAASLIPAAPRAHHGFDLKSLAALIALVVGVNAALTWLLAPAKTSPGTEIHAASGAPPLVPVTRPAIIAAPPPVIAPEVADRAALLSKLGEGSAMHAPAPEQRRLDRRKILAILSE